MQFLRPYHPLFLAGPHLHLIVVASDSASHCAPDASCFFFFFFFWSLLNSASFCLSCVSASLFSPFYPLFLYISFLFDLTVPPFFGYIYFLSPSVARSPNPNGAPVIIQLQSKLKCIYKETRRKTKEKEYPLLTGNGGLFHLKLSLLRYVSTSCGLRHQSTNKGLRHPGYKGIPFCAVDPEYILGGSSIGLDLDCLALGSGGLYHLVCHHMRR